jgi:hypothetical protein
MTYTSLNAVFVLVHLSNEQYIYIYTTVKSCVIFLTDCTRLFKLSYKALSKVIEFLQCLLTN